MSYSLADPGFSRTLLRLGPVRLRRLLRSALGRSREAADREPLTDGEALVLWAAVELMAVPGLGPEEQGLVVDELAADVRSFGDKLAALLDVRPRPEVLPVAGLTVAGLPRRWARLSGRKGCLDLASGLWSAGPDGPVVHSAGIDLTALFVLNRARARANPEQPHESRPGR